MNVEQVMTNNARCCREQDTIRDCAKLMKEESIGFVPICSDDGKPIGTITDRDLTIRALAEGCSADETLSRFMTRDVVACRADDDVKEAERLMREHRKSRIVVCDDQGKLQGVVSLQDLAEIESEAETGQTLRNVKSDQPSAQAH
jgi:CBS domain-containing protein